MLKILQLKIEKIQDVISTLSFLKEIWYFLWGWHKKHVLTLAKNDKVNFKKTYLKRVNFNYLILTMRRLTLIKSSTRRLTISDNPIHPE